jgi:uncharacterized ubiquitin-like protein YukD
MKPPSLRSKRASFYLSLLSFLCPFCLYGEIRAQELNNPYNLHIVVHVAENRLLTDVFRKNIERELRDGFQSALGDMAHVEVTDKHPRLADVRARGLRSLEGWKDRNDQKTHFVLIDYTGTHYEIQTRQYDGTIGLPSPVVRIDRTRDRAFVAKAAALLIKQDFGILGTIQSGPEGAKKQVKIELRGGGLGDMTRWVEKDDVFALTPPGGGTQASLKWSLLQVEQAPAKDARNGVCLCRFFHRYEVRGGIAGYRCIKLGTIQTPLHLRWMQRQRVRNGFRIKPPGSTLLVEVRRYGFDNENATKLEKPSDTNGFMDTASDKDGVFNNVAFVRVSSGLGDSHPQVPIALVDDQLVTIEVLPSKDVDSSFTFHLSQWQNSVAESVQMQADLFNRLKMLGSKGENRSEMLSAAASGLKWVKDDLNKLRKDRKGLAEEAEKNKKDLKTSIEDRQLQQLENYEKALATFIDEEKKIEEKENDPQRKKWLSEIQKAKLLVNNDLEIDKAIEIFERVRKEGYEDAELDKYVEKLHKEWDPRSPEHEEARKFIYRVWPALDLSRLEENILKVRNAFKTCKDVGDSISIEKLLRGTLGHADRLKKKLDELQLEPTTDAERESIAFKKVSEQIVKLGLEIEEYRKLHSDK